VLQYVACCSVLQWMRDLPGDHDWSWLPPSRQQVACVLQCVVECRSVLQCVAVYVAVCCSVLRAAVCCNGCRTCQEITIGHGFLLLVNKWLGLLSAQQRQTPIRCLVFQRLAPSCVAECCSVCCSVLQCVAVFCSGLLCVLCFSNLLHPVLQCVALQHTATHCNTLQHTATHPALNTFWI